ncbi:mas-related G-protein coupled receptor member H-like [Podarcis raffonei]|uniref:mas-related G-protein coupled receptor member H-like n=1 Tax=Podarcis raffonei TaxID=65483 RepID=UPI0023297F90|nr:mas-related G-protein coupled receptor member H-like [Podarcis raffonei]
MRNNSMESLSLLDTAENGNRTNNGTELPKNNNPYFELGAQEMAFIIIAVFSFVICIFGLIGNGTVIWFLGFRMKRNPFTTFILHLAVADLGVLICSIALLILLPLSVFSPSLENITWFIFFGISTFFFFYMYITGQFLLTAISVDRCVSVLFPIWHRCHRPQHLSTIVCALIWILTFLSIGLCIYASLAKKLFFFFFLVPPVLCFPLMLISTVILLIKVCFRSQQRNKGRVLRAILLALLFFLFFTFTLTFMILLLFLRFDISSPSLIVGHLCSCLNSSVNPLIYFLVGRKKQNRSRESMKVALRRLFKEEEHGREELELRVSPQI